MQLGVARRTPSTRRFPSSPLVDDYDCVKVLAVLRVVTFFTTVPFFVDLTQRDEESEGEEKPIHLPLYCMLRQWRGAASFLLSLSSPLQLPQFLLQCTTSPPLPPPRPLSPCLNDDGIYRRRRCCIFFLRFSSTAFQIKNKNLTRKKNEKITEKKRDVLFFSFFCFGREDVFAPPPRSEERSQKKGKEERSPSVESTAREQKEKNGKDERLQNKILKTNKQKKKIRKKKISKTALKKKNDQMLAYCSFF